MTQKRKTQKQLIKELQDATTKAGIQHMSREDARNTLIENGTIIPRKKPVSLLKAQQAEPTVVGCPIERRKK